MSSNLRFHNGYPGQTSIRVMYSTLVDSDVSLSISGGTAVDSGRTDRHADGDYIATGYFEITGLSPFTKYTYTISQGNESYTGSFRTAPSDQKTKYSVLMRTCTNDQFRRPGVWRDMRKVIREYESIAPVVCDFDIDDVAYFDDMYVGNAEHGTPLVLTASTGYPQDTGLVKDYANAYAAWHGHEPAYGMYYNDDFQWILRNVASARSGGDHMFEYNHCSGQIGNGDYHGCNRGPLADVPNLEENALTVWHAFIGDGNPATLGSGTDLHWGMDLGPVRFILFDRNLTSVPYDGADTTQDCYGATELGEIMAHADQSAVPIKCFLSETGWSRVGQPWREWWTTEADAWAADFLSRDNLNGTDGWTFSFVGDNHTVHVGQLDHLWWFCTGTTGGSATINWVNTVALPPQLGSMTGRIVYYQANLNDSNRYYNVAAFAHLIVHADETPKRLEMRMIEAGGNEICRYEMTCIPGNNNQWVNSQSRRISFGGGI